MGTVLLFTPMFWTVSENVAANTPVHARTHLKTSRWHHPPWQRQPGFACNPALNPARRRTIAERFGAASVSLPG
jgi:hypothetical protein